MDKWKVIGCTVKSEIKDVGC